MKILYALAFSIAVAGCASAPSPAPAPSVVCLPMVAYTAAQEKAAGDALAALDAGSELVAMMTDYGAMRSADRSCIASQSAK